MNRRVLYVAAALSAGVAVSGAAREGGALAWSLSGAAVAVMAGALAFLRVKTRRR